MWNVTANRITRRKATQIYGDSFTNWDQTQYVCKRPRVIETNIYKNIQMAHGYDDYHNKLTKDKAAEHLTASNKEYGRVICPASNCQLVCLKNDFST